VAGFCIVGRPDNDYWGLLLAPLWPLGLLQADRAAAGLWRACRTAVSSGVQHEAVKSRCPATPESTSA
jgi:hypothetical protein